MGSFKFDNVSTEDLGLVVQTPPSYTFPTRDMSSISIPGRNGELYIDNKSYKQSERTYLIGAAVNKNETIYDHAGKVIQWLNSTKGKYCRLEDSYDRSVFREASFISNGTVTNYLDQAFAFNITFKCKPQRFLKSGEEELAYNASEVEITNPTVYEAKPLITLEGITSDMTSKVLMMSVINNGNPVANVTINVPESEYEERESISVIIDSENQIVYDENQNDLTYYVSMNGKEFPYFGAAESLVKLEAYDKNNKTYLSYNHFIDDYISESEGFIQSLYKPYDAVVKEKAKVVTLKSYKQLLVTKQETYQANSLYAHMREEANTYTFVSFNSYLESISQVISIGLADIEQGIDFSNYGFTLTHNSTDKVVIVTALNAGFYMLKSDKNIRYSEANSEIGRFKDTNIDTIYIYKSDTETKTIDISGYIADMPDWLGFEIIYSDKQDVKKTLNNIKYKAVSAGYYYTPKDTGLLSLFSKDKWEYKSNVPFDLQTLKWDTGKLAFVKSGLNPSTTESFEYVMSEDIIQYEDVYVYEKDEDDNEVKRLASECHFTVESNSSTLDTVTVKIKSPDVSTGKNHNGWYRYVINDDDTYAVGWIYCNENQDTILTTSGRNSFIIYRIGEHESDVEYEKIDSGHIPNYYYPEETDDAGNTTPGWPEWIDPRIYRLENGTPVLIQDLSTLTFVEGSESNIYFMANTAGYYRFTVTIDGSEKWTDFVETTANSIIEGTVSQPFNKTVGETFQIAMVEEDPETFKFDYNRCYNKGEDSEDERIPPSWLDVEFNPVPEDVTKTPKKIIYKAGANGLYKWDNNTSWVSKSEGDLLFESEGKENASFYYMANTPVYPDDDNIHVEIDYDPATGNPKKMRFIIKTPGYYRVNNENNWRYINVGEQLFESEINVDNIVYKLDESSETLESVTIKIVPRWWML